MTTAKGGKPATGQVKWTKDKAGLERWHGRVTMPDGTRRFVALDPAIPRTDEARAKVCAVQTTEFFRTASVVKQEVKETVAEYAARWCAWRERRGLGCVKDDRALLAHHVLPTIGAFDVHTIARDNLKRLVTELDGKAKRGFSLDTDGNRRAFGWKTAINAWVTVRAMFRDARGAKDVDLCVRDDNPADGVSAPDTGAKKAKAYLWPSEFLALVSCDGVPLRWRRLFALAVYLYVRAGELDALEWPDVDLEHGTIHVHRSLDTRRGRGAKATKSDAARRIPIEPNLMPLLGAMHGEARGKGPVLRLPGDGGPAKLRMYLKRAGVKRTDLFTTDATRKAITFHDLRATGITWCAVRGDEPLKIMQRAGHADFETTKIYLREAENLSQGFGVPFPALPIRLIRPRDRFGSDSDKIQTENGDPAENKRNRVAPPGLEPGHPHGSRILSPLRIPIPPRGLAGS